MPVWWSVGGTVTARGYDTREYQLQCARQIWGSFFVENHQCVLVVAPTGSGKTVISSFFILKVIEILKWSVLFMAGRREIIHQSSTKLYQGGLWPGIIMAGEPVAPMRELQVASIQTYLSWRRRGKLGIHKPQIVVVDEAHGIGAKELAALIDEMKADDVKILGMTATPIGTNGIGLGKFFTKMICTPGFKWMAAHEPPYLVLPEYFSGIQPDLNGVKIVGKDKEFDERAVNAVIDTKMLVGNVVDMWFKHSPWEPTILFANSVPHSMHLEEMFRNANSEVKIQHIDGETDHDIRDNANRELGLGMIHIISNYGTHVEGTDIPAVSCIIDAAPTTSLRRYLQRGGRGSRTSPSKTRFNYHCHSGNVQRHGRLELEREWILCEGKENLEMNDRVMGKAKKERVCPGCGHLFTGSNCNYCGEPYKRTPEEMPFLEADLVHMTNDDFHDAVQLRRKKLNDAQRGDIENEFMSQALGWCLEHGKKPGMAFYAFEAKFKKPPPKGIRPANPSTEVEQYMKHRLIRAARGLQAQRRRERS